VRYLAVIVETGIAETFSDALREVMAEKQERGGCYILRARVLMRDLGPSVLQNLHSGAALRACYGVWICYFPVKGLVLLFNGLSHLPY
jgi:hypothetical protein